MAGGIPVAETDPESLHLLASALHLGGAREEATKLLQDACTQHPTSFWLNHRLATTLAAQDRSQHRDARRAFALAVALRADPRIRIPPLDLPLPPEGGPGPRRGGPPPGRGPEASPRLQEARRRLDEGDPGGAVRELERVLLAEPGHEGARRMLAVIRDRLRPEAEVLRQRIDALLR